MTMHDLNSALRFADKVLFMKNGEIYSASERAEITPEVVEAVYGLPVTIEQVRGHPVVMPL
jgi:iron complex transport system ATP-binding protein